jgi:hypothetical protein
LPRIQHEPNRRAGYKVHRASGEAVMTETEVKALLDAHDGLVTACLDSSLPFAMFVSAYDGFPHNYALDGHEAISQEERAVLALFRTRIAFHLRVAGVMSRVGAAEDSENPLYAEAGRFAPAVTLMRLRELVARHPGFEAQRA